MGEIELESVSLTAIYRCGDCGSGHQIKDMIQHKVGCVHYDD